MYRIGRTDAQHRANVSQRYALLLGGTGRRRVRQFRFGLNGRNNFPIWLVHADYSLRKRQYAIGQEQDVTQSCLWLSDLL
jgi:hypothetical protein